MMYTTVNAGVIFKPTPNALKQVNKNLIQVALDNGTPEDVKVLKTDEEGFLQMEMWDFMNKFGPVVGIGKPVPTDGDILILDESDINPIKSFFKDISITRPSIEDLEKYLKGGGRA